ncbi:AEC family transporter [Clostridium tertium]|uniref:AEC family transporter n=1 Tax=Clostridium TaxID=1485 RepID=UPI000C083603|nr:MULTISPECIES: AEC family transporter [Clostridium]MBS5307914.1 AEC family transporter [Clostridium sp.]MBU6136036.1 AEC family transporter [Clostridium tertium]MDB1921314.1 AEC family transporter [Clostridium tertium]MDB1924559.1 AEC family transporter [Clostridium tertium]MDB1928089.1 AEC family transporter [Clostridium tertium]
MIVFNKIIALFLIILIGVYGTKKHIINDDVNKGLRRILLEITLPLLVINSFSFSFDEGMGRNIITAFIYSILFMILGGIISYILLKPLKGEKKKILHFANFFSNCGFIGFPIINSIFGAEGVVYTSIFNMVFTIFLWTYGVMIFSDKLSKENIKKVLLNPSIIAVYIGIPIMIFNIKLPASILDTTKIVGDMTAPISMIIVGSILSKVKIKSIFKEASVYYGALIKLIVIPLAIYMIKLIIKDNSSVIDTIIVIQAMPAAAMTSIFAADFDKEKEYGAIVVFVTTLLSIITIPVIVKVIGL